MYIRLITFIWSEKTKQKEKKTKRKKNNKLVKKDKSISVLKATFRKMAEKVMQSLCKTR